MSWKFPFLKTSLTTSSAIVIGALGGAGAAIALCVATGLSPLAAVDRPALALVGLVLVPPMAAMVSRRASSAHDARLLALRAVVAGAVLASLLTLAEPELWIRTIAWYLPLAVTGAAAATCSRGLAVAAVIAWLAMCGLPFFCHAVPFMAATAESWALGATPWIGFSQDALGGDPLRREVIYMGHWSSLADQPATNLLQTARVWVAAILSLGAAMVLTAFRKPAPMAPSADE